MPSMDLVFRFLGVDAGAGPEFDRMAGKASTTKRALETVAFGAATAAAGVTIAAVKMAGDFQTSMTRIHTQANQSNKTVAALSKGVLDMAGAVASTPNTLAQAAYHIASIGQHSLTTAQQLAVLRTATEGAKIGGADLVDVTNALDAAIVAHIKGVKNYNMAMGALNATVGAGDMTMQDLADAFGPLGSTFKGFGVSIQQAGAALATFGDNNIRGRLAGNQLRQTITSLADPLSAGQAQLQAWGIKAGNLAAQLSKGGLTAALDLLAKKMHENGITASTMGPKLAEMFGKRGPQQGLSILLNELNRYHSKLGEVTSGGNNFAKSWQGYTKTFGYALDSARASAETLLVQFGTKLLPIVTKFTNWIAQVAIPDLSKFGSWLQRNSAWTKPLAIGIAAVGAALMVAFGGPVAIITGLTAIGIGLVELYQHSETFRNGVQAAGRVAVSAFNSIKPALVSMKGAFVAAFDAVRALINDFVVVTLALWRTFGHTIVSFLRSSLRDVGTMLRGAFQVIQGLFEVFTGILTGHWSKAWTGIKDIAVGVWNLIKGAVRLALDSIKAEVSLVMNAVSGVWHRTWNGILRVFGDISGYIILGLKDLVSAALSFMSTFLHAGSSAFGWVPVIGGKLKGASRAFDNFKTSTLSTLQDLANKSFSLGQQAGYAVGSGVAIGINSRLSAVESEAGTMGNAVSAKLRATLKTGSPSKVTIRIGEWVAQGLAIGMNNKGKEVYLSGSQVAHQLAIGLTEGFKGESVKVKDSLSQTLQSELSTIQAKLAAAVTVMQNKVKAAHSKLTADLNSRNQSILSLRDSIAGNSDISNVLGLTRNVTSTDFTGGTSTQTVNQVNYTGNIRGYLAGQAALLKREAGMFAKLRKMGLSPFLLSQISGLAPADAITIMQQIMSGQDGSLRTLTAYENQIRSYSKQIATGTVNTPHELATLKGDHAQIREQTLLLHKIESHLKDFRDRPESPVNIRIALHELGFTDAEVKKLMRQMEKIRRESGGRVKVG